LLKSTREAKECGTNMHTPLMCTLSFNNDNEFKGFPTFSNPLYASLEYYDLILNEKITSDNIRLCDEPINHIFNIQAFNHKSEVLDLINTFNFRCKTHLVGWNVLKHGDHFFWALVGLFPQPYAFVGWHVSVFSLHKVFQVVKYACKTNDAYLYAKCHPT
jgi:hypothetical protein